MATADSTLTKRQRKVFGPKHTTYYGEAAVIKAEVRFDDDCGNGHNTFSITGDIHTPRGRDVAGGCLHEEICKAFPELAPYVKWHLCSTSGPMHYVANTVYLAGDRDCHGRTTGQACAWDRVVYFTGFPLGWRPNRSSDFVNWLSDASGADFEILQIDHDREPKTYGPKWTLGGAPDKWYQCPFDTESEALEFLEAMRRGYEVRKVPTDFSKGKSRELDAARRAALWPDATDEDLTAPGLKERLEARLPALLTEFRAAVESLGVTW